jgi:hypothetical protein
MDFIHAERLEHQASACDEGSLQDLLLLMSVSGGPLFGL